MDSLLGFFSRGIWARDGLVKEEEFRLGDVVALGE